MKNKQHRELAVCGFEAVYALAERHPERINRLFFTQDRARFFGPVCKLLASNRKLYRTVESPLELEKLCQSVHHQGVVAMISEPEIRHLSIETLDAWHKAGEKVLVLDRVGNANNLGAIIRSAAFFGIKKIVIGEDDEQAEISTSAYRVAQGGMEFVELYQTSSAAWLVVAAAGKMKRIGADHRARNNLSDLRSIAVKGEGIMIVMGNEESGLSPEVKESCDQLVRIPGTGDVESLNVAQAATLFLYELSIL
jgi:RNA methyltransferase, TrmH family